MKDLVYITTEKKSSSLVNVNNYVSTENILPNRGGIRFPAKSLPQISKIFSYQKNDILVSNIRPYFKKIWFSDRDGVRSNDVLAFRTKNSKILLQKYLYLVLQNDKFFDYVTLTSKGTKMPRGDKNAILNFTFEIPSISIQKKLINYFFVIESKIKLNNLINDNLMELKTTIFNKMFSINLTNCLNGKIKDIAEVRTGKRPKIKYSKKGSTPIYPIIGASKIMGYTDEYLYNKSIITTGRVGTLGIVKRYREPVWVSDNSFIFITKYEDYLYELLTHFINYSALNIGSTQPLITQTEFKNVDIYIPKREELIEFKEKVVTLTEQQFELRQQNRLLNDLKSYLLSKLF